MTTLLPQQGPNHRNQKWARKLGETPHLLALSEWMHGAAMTWSWPPSSTCLLNPKLQDRPEQRHYENWPKVRACLTTLWDVLCEPWNLIIE